MSSALSLPLSSLSCLTSEQSLTDTPANYTFACPSLQGELQLLCMQLDRHIGTHVRESPQAMHRTKLKDLAAQTYVRWQELLAHCQPQVVPPAAPTWEGREVVRQLTRDRACPPTVQLFSSWLGDG